MAINVQSCVVLLPHASFSQALETYEALPDASPATGGAGEGVDESEVKTKAAQARCISARATLAYGGWL
jgi:hypothetical protein